MTRLPHLVTAIPGPRSRALSSRLAEVESRNITCLAHDGADVVFWERGEGVAIVDVDGNRFLDATSAFGVAGLGHAHPQVAAALAAQAAVLPHGMGDVHPTRLKVELCERLASLSPLGPGTRVILASTGAEAIEAALKTARLASGKPGVLAFTGAYHGLTYGALGATHRPFFRAPFADQLRADIVTHVPYSRAGLAMLSAERAATIGAILLEPIQGRGGIVVPEPGLLADARRLATRLGAVLVFDEIFTGCGRTGTMFALEHEQVLPDVLVLGKALSNGFPISAVLGRAGVMAAWPPSQGEAIHTSTHLGSPLGCAAALATLDVIQAHGLVARARTSGADLARSLGELVAAFPGVVTDVRGRGLMLGLGMASGALAARTVRAALARGLFLLPAGETGEVIEVLPPLVIDEHARHTLIEILHASIAAACATTT